MDVRFEIIIPVVAALIAGAAIGYEREFRGRAAGFRTHTLVCLASCVLTLASRHQMEWSEPFIPAEVVRIDPARMAHGILTGIGFLCGGVIFKEGLTVHGLTTAASLWTTSALGILFGVGFYDLAIGATLATLFVLVVFRMVDVWMPGQFLIDTTLRYASDNAPSEGEVTDLLKSEGHKLHRMARVKMEGGRVLEYGTVIKCHGRPNLDQLAALLEADGRLVEYRLLPRND